MKKLGPLEPRKNDFLLQVFTTQIHHTDLSNSILSRLSANELCTYF